MTRHPREGYGTGGRELSRREFLSKVGSGLAIGGLGLAGAACGSSSGSPAAQTGLAVGPGGLPLPRPSRPVKWPIYKDNAAIASNLKPEEGATLQVYNWVAYINQAVVNNFAKKYKCKVQVTTFNTMTEALAKLQAGQIPFDVFFPTVDVLGQLVAAKLVRPLNHGYIPNITQAWKEFQNPFYDQSWQYTVPYTIYTTGVAWRKDHVPENPYTMSNPWAMPWQAKYRGKVAILDDYRESIALAMMKRGIYNLNTTNPAHLATAKAELENLNSLVHVHIDNNDYTNVPSGQIWIHHAWSGDMAASAGYMPKGVPVEVVGYWFPTDGKGPVNNDMIVSLASGQNPVLSHLFVNYMLDLPNVLENISFNGYMQPIEGVTPARLISEKILPPSLASTVVLPHYFDRGVMELELATSVDAAYEQTWNSFSDGL
jgi:spermidine/putrescine transport system substrate-binding protein